MTQLLAGINPATGLAVPVQVDANGILQTSGSVGSVGGGNSAGSGTSSVTRVATSSTAAQLLAANTARNGGYQAFNESSAIMYLLEGTGTPSATFYSYQVPAGQGWSNDKWTGRVAAVLASGTGNAAVTEYSA